MNRKQTAVIVSTLGGLAAMHAPGAAISVNFDSGATGTPSLLPTDVAGVVAAENWNNLQTAAVGQPFDYGMTYVDDSGTATSLVFLTSGGTSDTWNTVGTPNEVIFGDKLNMDAVGTKTLSLSTVPYDTYDLYLYSSFWTEEVVEFAIGANVQNLTNTFTPQFTADDDFVLNDTYVKFEGLSGDVVVTMAATDGGVHLGGFQIVEAIPEPSTALLLGLAGMGLFVRRRLSR